MVTRGTPDIPSSVFARRRAATLDRLGDGVLVLPAAPIQHSSRDTERPYQPDRELYYLTGATEPEAVAVLVGGEERKYVLFVRERDPEAELWAGPRLGVEGSSELLAPDECLPVADLDERLAELLQLGDRVHFRLGGPERVERLVRSALAHARNRGQRKGSGPRGVVDPGEIIDELRLRKDEVEVARLREAGEVSALGHRAGASVIGPGEAEGSVAATIDLAFRRHGGRGPGYETIVGSGANACVLHYVANDGTIGAGDLVLVDAGADVGLYNGDITRTYPASGRFGDRQREIYELVDAARSAAIRVVRPGATIADVHAASLETLVAGLVDLGVLKGDVAGVLEEEKHKPYFPHQTSHWLGLDVHDPGDYTHGGASRVLEPGMVFTVEPGLYFRPGDESDAAAPFAGIGVRIEDDVVVTDDGCEVLTASVPTAADEVEALVGASP